MSIRKNQAMGFVDCVLAGGPKSAALLEKLDNATPWKKLARPILHLPEYKTNNVGRPAWDPIVMLKCMMLQRWFNLSDPQLEEQLMDRISFRKFVGLSFDDATPDETTFVRFRNRLRDANIHEYVFNTVVKHLDSQGYLVREGTMVDATIIEQSTGRKNDKDENTRDTDASFTKKHGKTFHGYKAHIACDLSGIITDYRFTTAKKHDSTQIDDLILHERNAVFADSAYASKQRRKELCDRGVIDGIIYKRNRGQEILYDWQVDWNIVVSKVRAKVEHPFAMLKHQLKYRKVKYRGWQRNEFDVAFMLTACNLKKSLSLE